MLALVWGLGAAAPASADEPTALAASVPIAGPATPRPGDDPHGSGRAIPLFSQRVPDDLRVGPGFGVHSAPRRPTSAFPVLLVDWRPADRLALTAGRELDDSTGPGVYGTLALARHADVTLGFRFERTRFRLAPRPGLAVHEVGDEQRLPAFAAIRVGPPHAFVALVAGADLRGRLRIQDERGGFLAERVERPSPFAAVAGRILF